MYENLAKIKVKTRSENNEKTRQNTENKQTLEMTGKIEVNEKIRQNSENKQTKIEIEGGKLVKTLNEKLN